MNKNLVIVASIALMLLVIVTVGISVTSKATSDTQRSAQAEHRHIAQLTEVCHAGWLQYDWTIGEQGALASDNIAFSDGVRRICQARAELFFEGYELSPFISRDDQQQIFPIVFIPTVEELKSVMRQNLPALRVI